MADNFHLARLMDGHKGVITRNLNGDFQYMPYQSEQCGSVVTFTAAELREIAEEIDRKVEEAARKPAPCPFCGSSNTQYSPTSYQVICNACGARGAVRGIGDRAVSNWNRVAADVAAASEKVPV